MSVSQHLIIDQLLRDTARSFYLTLQALPTSIRQPLSIAYLLARATDTVADVSKLPAQERLLAMNALATMIRINEVDIQKLSNLVASLTPKSAEYNLLMHIGELIDALYTLDDETRQDIIDVLTIIIQGQCLDINRFSDGNTLTFLTSKEELNEYTYLVAGCVGEFWTKLCFKKIKHYSDQSLSALLPLAVAFGKGLQLTNILRDLPNDINQGRCYLPREELQKYGINPADISKNVDLLAPVTEKWQQIAINDLRLGWQYMLNVTHRRIRAAIALPILLAFATLDEMQDTQKKPVKISRTKVKILILIAMLSMLSARFFCLLRLFHFYPLIRKQ